MISAASCPADRRALVAVDLGAESCRVSLLRWQPDGPHISLVQRFVNAPREAEGLRWDLTAIEQGLDHALRQCAAIASEGIRSIAVDGWAVDYVRLDPQGRALADPFCYRDLRTESAEAALHRQISPERMRGLTGVQLLRINTVYQLYADILSGNAPARWLNLPEYILFRWGAEPVAEYTNATHSQMVSLAQHAWNVEIMQALGLDPASCPKIVPPGTIVGQLTGPLAALPAFAGTLLIAPACHDTASAVAGIPAEGGDWAYISAGTWSLVGTIIDKPLNNAEIRADNFTNLGAADGRTLLHKNVNGMWLLQQLQTTWESTGGRFSVKDLVEAAEHAPTPDALLDVDDPALLLPGPMQARINHQRRQRALPALNEHPDHIGVFTRLIFHSLATRYAEVLQRIEHHTGKHLRRLFIVGGASQNEFLNRLTAEATGLTVHRGPVESSTNGNFAVQLAVLEASSGNMGVASPDSISRWAGILADA